MLVRSARSSCSPERDTHDVSGCPSMAAAREIAVLPTFASRWLIPRLGRFAAQHPHIVVNIAARSDPFILPDLMPPSILNTRRGPEWR